MSNETAAARGQNSPRQVLFASLIGTTIEFFDFYIYATAAVLVFPQLFFPTADPASATLQSLAVALNVPLTNFFSSLEQKHDITHVRAGEGLVIERRGTKAGHQYQLLGHPFPADFAYEPYLVTLSKGAEPYPNFRHEGMEFIFILEGEVGYRHGNHIYPLGPGDSLFFNANSAHGPEELRQLPLKFLSIIVFQREQ